MDVYGSVAVVISTAAWIELNRSTVIYALKELPAIDAVIWQSGRSMLELEGLAPRMLQGTAKSQVFLPCSCMESMLCKSEGAVISAHL